MNKRSFLVLLPCVLACGMAARAQSNESTSANDLARQVITNELKMQDQDHTHWMYEVESVKDGVKQTSYTVETSQGDLSRLIAKNGQPLNDAERKAEEQRIEKYLNDPDAQRKKRQESEQDSRQTRQLFQMLPDALNFTYAEHNGDTVKLNFEPNPSFHPPSRQAKVFHELEGQMTVNVRQKRLMEIDGHLKDEVHFGILGHLNKGGTFHVRQEEVSPGHWEIAQLKVNMQGRALFFKTISVQQDEVHSHYKEVPDNLTLQQGKDMLDKQASQPPKP